jgi:hypothetical protein
VWHVVKLAARAAVWRRTADPQLVALPVLLAFAALLAAVRAMLQLVEAGSWHAFNPYGLNAVVAWIALELAIAALFVRPAARTTALSAMFVLSVIADIAMTAISAAVPLVAGLAGHADLFSGTVLPSAIYALLFAWWVGAMTCIVGSLEQQSGWRLAGRIAGLWVALFAANIVVPHAPVFVPPDFDPRSANWWETVYATQRAESKPRASGDIAQIERIQPKLLHEQFAQLPPSRKGETSGKGETNLYALALAGWAEQDVFVKELDGGLQALASVLPIKGRMVRLINHRDTVKKIPLANVDSAHDFTWLSQRLCPAIAGRPGRPDAATGRGDTRRRGHQEPRGDRFGVLFGNLCTAAGKRQHDRDDRGRCGTHVLRLRSRARLDVFRRCLLPSQPASGLRFRKRVQSSPHPDPWLGNDGPRDAVKSAGLVWADARRKTRAVLCDESASLIACSRNRDCRFLRIMLFDSENRQPLFGIMLKPPAAPVPKP